jgi:hypothetical protein
MKLLLASVVICCASPTYAALILDQSNTAAPGDRYLVPNVDNTAAQVVTAGVSGQLAKIELGAFRVLEGSDEPLLVDIATTVGELPDFSPAARLATRTIEREDVPPGGDPLLEPFILAVDFSADNLYFAEGERFAILLRSDYPLVGYGWWINSPVGSTYAGGIAYSLFLPPFPPNGLVTFGDAYFRTFVNAPEPSALALALFCFSLVARAVRTFADPRIG